MMTGMAVYAAQIAMSQTMCSHPWSGVQFPQFHRGMKSLMPKKLAIRLDMGWIPYNRAQSWRIGFQFSDLLAAGGCRLVPRRRILSCPDVGAQHVNRTLDR